MKIVTVIGARPQFVKAAVVSRAISKHIGIEEIIIHTGQHFDSNMSDIFFEEMSIPKPNYNLNINGLSHGAMTGQMLEKIEEILIKESPDYVLVYGDTNSTLAGALAAKKLNIKVAHVEAGLRSFNMSMPEEINRILTDRISDILFVPTDNGIENLNREGFSHGSIFGRVIKCGDVMQDAAIFYATKAIRKVETPDRYILATIHRAENTDNKQRLLEIFKAFEEISSKFCKIVLPLHPRTKSRLMSAGHDIEDSNITFLDPIGYLEMISLLKGSALVMTDSGGVQKEAYFFDKYCITLREETEWIELVNNGYNWIAGASFDSILNIYRHVCKLGDINSSQRLYGNGDAGEIIISELVK